MPVPEIGNILLNSKAITKEQLNFALMIQKNINPSQRLGRILKYYNFASDKKIAQALARQVGWRYFNKKYVLNLPIIEKIGLDFLTDRVFLPVETEKGLVFVFAYPFDIEATDLLASEGLRGQESYIGSESVIRNHLEQLKRRKKRKEIDKKISLIKETGVVGDELKGLLDELLHDAIIQHAYSDHPVDIRVSCIPSVFGPALVLRLLDANKTLITLEDLGFDATHFDNINHIVRKPHGIIIVTGPTGSGKTTTLYAILNQLKSLSTKVITIEDPVEIKMPLINQVQINEKQGISFAQATRAFLRHDPDIILIGEIRDHDTAREAIRASITGHRVLSTLHTNTAVDSIYRLHDLGIGLAHIANSILCVISQRLIRKLCLFCRKRIAVKKDVMPDFLRKILQEDEDEINVFKARGCDHCQAGYKGRTVIAEILSFNDDIRDMVSSGKLDVLRHKRKEEAYLTLEQDAAMLILKGVTSPEEAERVVG